LPKSQSARVDFDLRTRHCTDITTADIGEAVMTFRDARDMVVEFTAKLPTLDHTHPLAGCSIDRIE